MGTKDLDGGRGCLPSVALIILIHHIRKERMEHIGQLIYSQIERVPDAVEVGRWGAGPPCEWGRVGRSRAQIRHARARSRIWSRIGSVERQEQLIPVAGFRYARGLIG
jgi:hypothetical protein